MSSRILYLFALSLCLLSSASSAADSGLAKSAISVDLGYGSQFALPVAFVYRFASAQLQYDFRLFGSESVQLQGVVYPHVGITSCRETDTVNQLTTGVECALSVGIMPQVCLLDRKLNAYLLISTSPAYTSVTPYRQKPGFLFASHFAVGTRVTLSQDCFLDLRFAFRHISNDDLGGNNAGVNNTVFNIGVGYELR